MRNELKGLHQFQLRPIFVEKMPPFEAIKNGEIWISHKHRTINLRCPCGCGELTVLSIHPSRWHVYFDGKSISLKGTTSGSVWAFSGCGSHYSIRNNTVIWEKNINPSRHLEYANAENTRMIHSLSSRQPFRSWLRRVWRNLLLGIRRK